MDPRKGQGPWLCPTPTSIPSAWALSQCPLQMGSPRVRGMKLAQGSSPVSKDLEPLLSAFTTSYKPGH